MKAFGVAIAGLLMAAPVLAQANDGSSEENTQQPSTTATTEQPRTETAEAEEAEDGERRICRRMGDRTASLTAGRRVCMTAQQWRNARRD